MSPRPFEPKFMKLSVLAALQELTPRSVRDPSMRELLELDVADTPLVIEHEYPPARVQDEEVLPAQGIRGAGARAHRVLVLIDPGRGRPDGRFQFAPAPNPPRWNGTRTMAEPKLDVAVIDAPSPRVLEAIARPASRRWGRVQVP